MPTNYNEFHLGSPNLGWQNLPDGSGQWYYEPYNEEYSLQVVIPERVLKWRVKPWIQSYEAMHTYEVGTYHRLNNQNPDHQGWSLFLRRVHQNDGSVNYVFNPRKWQDHYGPSSIAIAENLVAPSQVFELNEAIENSPYYENTDRYNGDSLVHDGNIHWMSNPSVYDSNGNVVSGGAVEVELDPDIHGFQPGELWEFKLVPFLSSHDHGYIPATSGYMNRLWEMDHGVHYLRNMVRWSGTWYEPNNQNVQDRTAPGYGDYRISRDYSDYQGPHDDDVRTQVAFAIQSDFEVHDLNHGVAVKHEEGTRLDGTITGGQLSGSAEIRTEPYVVITSPGTHQNGTGLTDGQSFTFQVEDFEQTDSVVEMVNPHFTLYETPESGSEETITITP